MGWRGWDDGCSQGGGTRARARVCSVPRFVLSVAQGFASRTVAERRAQNERLFVMRFAREGQVERAGGEARAGAGAPPAPT